MGLIRLRQSAARTRTGGKSRGSAIHNKWSPPSFTKIKGSLRPHEEAMVAEPIVFVEGNYPDYYGLQGNLQPPSLEAYHHRSHRHVAVVNGRRKYRTIPCTKGPDEFNPKPCVGCYLIDHKILEEKNSGARDSWCFNIAHLTAYHRSPLVKDGVIQTKRESNEPIMVDKKCQFGTLGDRAYWQGVRGQQQCEYCAHQHELKLGGQRFWEMGKSHLDAVLDWQEKTLGRICFWTGTGIIHLSFACRNCNAEMLRVIDSGMTNEALSVFEQTPQPCQHCQQVLQPIRVYDSGYDLTRGYSKDPNFQMPVDPSTGQPAIPRPLELFDVVCWVQREGENTDSKPVITNWCRLTEAPFGANGETTDITDFVTGPEGLVSKPYDFDGMFDMPTDLQARLFETNDPYAAGQQQPFHGYGNGASQGFGGATLPPQQAPGPQAPSGYPQQPPQQHQGYPAQAPTQQRPFGPPSQQPPAVPPPAPSGYPQPPAPQVPPQAPPAQQPPTPIAAPYPQQAPPPPAPPQAPPAPPQAPQTPPGPPPAAQPPQTAPPSAPLPSTPQQSPTQGYPPLPPPAPVPGRGNQ